MVSWLAAHFIHWIGHWGFWAACAAVIIGLYIALANFLPLIAVKERNAFIVALGAVLACWAVQTSAHRAGAAEQADKDAKELSAAHAAQGKAEADKAFADAQVAKVEASAAQASAALDAVRQQQIAAQAAAEKRYAALNGRLGPDYSKASEDLGKFLQRETAK